jgi:hypothetical protein
MSAHSRTPKSFRLAHTSCDRAPALFPFPGFENAKAFGLGPSVAILVSVRYIAENTSRIIDPRNQLRHTIELFFLLCGPMDPVRLVLHCGKKRSVTSDKSSFPLAIRELLQVAWSKIIISFSFSTGRNFVNADIFPLATRKKFRLDTLMPQALKLD